MDLFFFYFYSIWLVSPAMKVHGVSYRHVTCKAFLKVKRVLNNFSAENVLVVDVQSQSYLHTYSKFLRSAFLLRFWSGSYPFVVVLVAAVKCHSLGLLTWYLVQWTKAICHRGDYCKFSWRTISSPCTMWNWIWGNYHATIQIRTRNEDSFSEKVVWNSLCKPKLNSVAVKTSGDSVEFRNNGEYLSLPRSQLGWPIFRVSTNFHCIRETLFLTGRPAFCHSSVRAFSITQMHNMKHRFNLPIISYEFYKLTFLIMDFIKVALDSLDESRNRISIHVTGLIQFGKFWKPADLIPTSDYSHQYFYNSFLW